MVVPVWGGVSLVGRPGALGVARSTEGKLMLSSSRYLIVSSALTLSSVAFAQTTAPAPAPVAPAAAPGAAPAPAPTSAAAPPPVAEPAPAPAAEPAPAAAEAPPPVEEPAPAAPPPVSEPAPAEPEDAAAGGRPPITKQSSLYLGSPIWMSNAPVDPGFEFELRGGLKIGILVPELGFGMRWNWMNVDKIEQAYPDVNGNLFAGDNLQGMWFSLGLRVEPTMKTDKIQPYLSGAFDMLLWGTSWDTTEFCGFWTCSTVRNYDFAPGFSGRAGLRFMPKPFIGIDLGAKVGMSFPGWAFQDTQSWVEPYAGFTFVMGAGKK
jgi:hypothetical protein